jgi:hypothetical protein
MLVLVVAPPIDAGKVTPLCARSAGEYATCGKGRGKTGLPFLSSSGNWLEVCDSMTSVVVTQSVAMMKSKLFLVIKFSFVVVAS